MPFAIIEYATHIPLNVNLRRRALNELHYYDQRIRELRNTRTAILAQAAFRDQLQHLILPFTEISNVSVSIRGVEIHLPVTAFTWADNRELFQLLEALENFTGVEPESCDHPQDGHRDYVFGSSIRLIASLTQAGAYNRVVVGAQKTTKWVEVEVDEPIYAFKC